MERAAVARQPLSTPEPSLSNMLHATMGELLEVVFSMLPALSYIRTQSRTIS
jgi:hypothetical protein